MEIDDNRLLRRAAEHDDVGLEYGVLMAVRREREEARGRRGRSGCYGGGGLSLQYPALDQ